MSDVPAAALWSAALFFSFGSSPPASGRRCSNALPAGICAALAVLVRPNLVPLALVLALFLLWPERRDISRRAWICASSFAVIVVPAIIAVAIINLRLYGSALRSGYDDLSSAYAFDHAAANARRYTAWLLATQTPLVTLSIAGLTAPFVTRSNVLTRRTSLIFMAFLFVIGGSYLTYAVFDDWRYLRFLLPLFPPMLVAMTAFILWALRPLPAIARVPAFVALAALLVGHELHFAIGEGIGRLAAVERRYVAVARFIEASTRRNAVFLSLQHAGSVRHYGGRLTLRFDLVPADLDAALSSLVRAGWRPFILLEDWEEPQFKRQFGASSEAGRLGWRPYARLDAPGGVNIYDPEQMRAAHDVMAIPPPGGCDCRHY
jgi:hypothetical protein